MSEIRDRLTMARRCLEAGDHWRTEQAENQAMRHIDAALDEMATGHECEDCAHWVGNGMWKGNPCRINFEPRRGGCEHFHAPTPRWTTEPPRVPGWYWSRFDAVWGNMDYHEPIDPKYTDGSSKMNPNRRWWPIPIPEPPQTGGMRDKAIAAGASEDGE